MALEKSDLKIGQIINNRYTAVKLLDYQWVSVDGLETRYWFILPGSTVTNRFVQDGGRNTVSVMTESRILGEYTEVWEPANYKDGDFLVSEDNKHVFLFTKNGEDEARVWLLNDESGATFQSSLKQREVVYGKLKKLRRGWTPNPATSKNLTEVKS